MSSLHSPEYRRMLRRLREAREQAGLTQVEVADALGQPQSWVSRSETGERRVDAVELQRFARLYGTTVSALLGEGDSGRR